MDQAGRERCQKPEVILARTLNHATKRIFDALVLVASPIFCLKKTTRIGIIHRLCRVSRGLAEPGGGLGNDGFVIKENSPLTTCFFSSFTLL